jgi:hypothetical protein
LIMVGIEFTHDMTALSMACCAGRNCCQLVPESYSTCSLHNLSIRMQTALVRGRRSQLQHKNNFGVVLQISARDMSTVEVTD